MIQGISTLALIFTVLFIQSFIGYYFIVIRPEKKEMQYISEMYKPEKHGWIDLTKKVKE